MSLVLDASAALACFFVDERTPDLHGLLARIADDGCVVPALWWFEVANGLTVALRRRRVPEAFRDDALIQLETLPITTDRPDAGVAWRPALALADRYGLTVYDAAYLDLARRRGLPLATLDRQLAEAARAAGVETLLTPP
ncbi:type II toxin-antitoxin system VapC family toxin [Magnetospirillum sp. UT-4]|uniref:type II toxin-antitoxin system VapC family toxin n=1 Tax=Magnetospirillum sp. UT-4 TaxID=2681467 RepID=UPI0013812F36|nr:type II toxin-antitoxin system VapC family toxin [Magnetospirillum sp. UT-4]CAA7623999.1 conserved hypothetical protein [Magnetospirillum sp. UT-4]